MQAIGLDFQTLVKPAGGTGGGGMRTVCLPREKSRTGPLVLVNRQHTPSSPAVLSISPPWTAAIRDILLDRRAAQLLAACVRKAGGGAEIVPVSGWRSQAEQQRIWDDTLAESGADFTQKYVALPGCSEHQTGLAIDLGKAADEIDFIRPTSPMTGSAAPSGGRRPPTASSSATYTYIYWKEALTGIAPEPWHFRYVGTPHALLMDANGLCLEEYGDFLRQGPRTCALPGGQRARVFCVPCTGEETEIRLPDSCCQISGDNAGGFIVTIWEQLPLPG